MPLPLGTHGLGLPEPTCGDFMKSLSLTCLVPWAAPSMFANPEWRPPREAGLWWPLLPAAESTPGMASAGFPRGLGPLLVLRVSGSTTSSGTSSCYLGLFTLGVYHARPEVKPKDCIGGPASYPRDTL